MEIADSLFANNPEQSRTIIEETSDVGDSGICSVQTDHNYHINGIVDNNNENLLNDSRINDEFDRVRASKVDLISRHFNTKSQGISGAGDNGGIGKYSQAEDSDDSEFEEALRLEDDPDEQLEQAELVEKNTSEIVQPVNHKVPQILDFTSPQNLKEKLSKTLEKLSNNFGDKLSSFFGDKLSNSVQEKSSDFQEKLSNNFAARLSNNFGEKSSNFEASFGSRLFNNSEANVSSTFGPKSSNSKEPKLSSNFLSRLLPHSERNPFLDPPEKSPSPEQRFSKNIEETFLQNYEEDSSDPEETLEEKYDLKSCTVEITRCDKIWDTLKLIKILQESQNLSEDLDYDEIENTYSEEKSSTNSEMDSSTSPMVPYIQYQPVLGNGNTALPNFQFSVKSTRPLYHCYTCGRQYSHRSTLRDHSERVHNIIIPLMRPPTTTTVVKKNDPSKLHETSSSQEDDSIIDMADDQPDDDDDLIDEPINEITESSKTSSNTSSTIISSLTAGKDGRMNCPYCERSYSDKYNLNYHLERVHGFLGLIKHRVASMRWRTINQTAMSVHRCHICAKHFYGDDKLKDHMQKEHGVSLDNLRNRINKKLQDMKSTRVRVQERKEKKEEKEKEKEIVGGEKVAPSVEMKKDEKDDAEAAAAEKKRKSLYECPVCKKLYVDKISWKIHLKKLHGILLPQGRRTRIELEEFLKSLKLGSKKPQGVIQGSKKPLGVIQASKKPLGVIQGTIKKNRGNRGRFECKICGAKFFRAFHYDSHMDKHGDNTPSTPSTNEKRETEDEEETKISKQTAKECDKKVSDCEYCGKVFRLPRNLSVHRPRCKLITKYRNSIRQTSKKQTFICNTCGKCYTSDSHLVRHLKDAHDVDIPSGIKRYPKEEQQVQEIKETFEKLEKREKPSEPSPLSRSLRAKERVNYDENIQMTGNVKAPTGNNKTLEIRQSEFKKIPDTPEEDGTQEGLIQCILCNRHCKKIYKHFTEYHKIRHPETVIAQCKPSSIVDFYALEGHGIKKSSSAYEPRKSQNSYEKPAVQKSRNSYEKSAVQKSQNSYEKHADKKSLNSQERQSVKRSPSLPELDKCVPSPPERKIKLEVSANVEEKKKSTPPRRGRRPHATTPTVFPVPGPQRLFVLINENNLKYYKCKHCNYRTYNYKQVCGHQAAHPVEYHESKGRRTSAPLDQSLPIPSSSSSVSASLLLSESRQTRSSIRMREETNFQCSICDRVFRNAEVLSSHKISCTPRLSLDLSLLDPNDTRESSDRDSGIGISITIKKKNDSYEIVSRDSSGERKPDDELSTDLNLRMETNADSVDVDDDINKNEKSSEHVDNGNLKDGINRKSNDDDDKKHEFNHDQNFIKNHHDLQLNSTILKMDTLVNLCADVLRSTGKLGRFQCPTCWTKWSSKKGLCTHRRVHRFDQRASL